MKKFSAVAAIHDVSPKWEKEICAIFEALQRAVPNLHPALLLVPNFHGRTSLFASDEFTARLRTWIKGGSEPVLHGWTHLQTESIHPIKSPYRWSQSKLLTAAEGEFLDLAPEETARRLQAGKTLLEQTLNIPLSGFVPPAWLRNRHLHKALGQHGFRFTEGHFYLYDLLRKERHFAPAVGFSGRTEIRATSSAILAGLLAKAPAIQSNLRLAIHPADWTQPTLRNALPTLFDKLATTHRFVSYAELLGKGQTV